jgi:predicted DNA-binding transcriptional regulator AlpA
MQSEVTQTFLKKADVCAQLGISPRTLENLVQTKQFPPAVRLGKWCYWSAKVLEAWQRRQFAVQEAWRPT